MLASDCESFGGAGASYPNSRYRSQASISYKGSFPDKLRIPYAPLAMPTVEICAMVRGRRRMWSNPATHPTIASVPKTNEPSQHC